MTGSIIPSNLRIVLRLDLQDSSIWVKVDKHLSIISETYLSLLYYLGSLA